MKTKNGFKVSGNIVDVVNKIIFFRNNIGRKGKNKIYYPK